MADLQRAFLFPILIPLGTTAPSSRKTFATYTLIGVSFLLFLAGFKSPLVSQQLAFYTHDDFYRYISYAFVHEPSWLGLAHLSFNMFFLWIFGSPLETRMGWWRFILLYLTCAAAGAATWDMFQSMPNIALIGSSGAVWGMIGAYLILWPFSSVICFFILFVIVLPIYATTYHALALLFPIVYYVLVGLIYFGAWRLDYTLPFGDVAWLAHLGGMAAGLGLTAAFYGFHGFTEEATDEEAAAKKLQLKLDRELHGFPAEGAKIGPPERPFTPMPAKLMPLHEAVVLGDRQRAVKLWHELLEPDETACLLPGPQMDLARILKSEHQTSAAIEALERLTKIHPDCELVAIARVELATLLVDMGADYPRAMALIREAEASEPPFELMQEIKQLRRRIPGRLDKFERPVTPSTALFEDEPEPEPGSPTIDDFIRAAEDSSRRADLLFGDPEDTDAFKMTVRKDAPPQLKLTHDDTTPPIMLDAEQQQANELFGNPDDTDAFRMNVKPDAPPQPKLTHDDTTPPIVLEAEEAGAKDLFGDPEDTGSFQMNMKPDAPKLKPLTKDDTRPPITLDDQSTPQAAPPDPRPARGSGPLAPIFLEPDDLLSVPPQEEKTAQPAEPAPKPRQEKFVFRSSILPKHEIKQSLQPKNPVRPLEPLDIQLERLKTSITPASGPTPEVFIGDITNFSPQPETSDTRDRRLVLRPGGKYAAILTPGCPVDIPLVCAAIAPVLGLSPDGTHHALLRRRGILAEDLTSAEAEELARNLSANGQSVSVVACDDQLEFGPPQDVLTYSDEGSSARFSISNEVLICRWSQAVFFSAGLVRLDPMAPGRALIDLFFAQPRAHLRIWENTFVYPDRVVVAAKGMENQRQSDSDHGFLRREWCFRSMAAEIDNHGRNAVRTRSFSTWLDQATSLPTAHFWSLIEYDNFLRWHLMAYHVPKKKFEAK